MYKLLVAAAVIAVASCEAEAEADPGYFYGAYPALYNAYPNWPGVSGPGFSSTCHGCRPYHYYGKRSADAEADPALFYGAYGYPYAFRPYYASGYAGPLPGASYQSVHRLHKREAEADPQLLAVAAPYVNDGPVAGPLTAAFGDLVATERGLRPISLEGFSEDVNQDGFVDPVAQAVPVVAAPVFPAPFAPLRTVACCSCCYC